MELADVAYAAALVLAATFAFAGGVKLQSRSATRDALAELQLPRPAILAVALPVAELGVAALLIVRPIVGAVAGLALLAFFSTVLAGRLRGGIEAPCGCFGSTSHDPISAVDLVRNLLLATFAVAALGASRPTVPGIGAITVVAGYSILTSAVVYALRVRRQGRQRGRRPVSSTRPREG